MRTIPLLSSSVLLATLASGLMAATAASQTVNIAAYDTMTYSVKRIEAHPGQKLVVTLTNKGTLPKNVMPHNWILLRAGASADAYAKEALRVNTFEPKELANEVITSIHALGPNESGTASFTVPMAPGTYPYLCTGVGHTMGGSGMRGVLIVK
jgi:azurin